MTRPRRILIVNPNQNRTVTDWIAREARRLAPSGLEIDAVNARSGLAAIETPADIAQASRSVLEAIAERPWSDAVLIAAFGDPGLEDARASSSMPVIGLGEAGLRAAGHGERPFALVTLGTALEETIRARVAQLGLDRQCVAVKVLPMSIAAFIEQRETLHIPLLKAVRRCFADDDAQAVLLGGAPFAGLAHGLAARCGRPVLDGIEASLAAVAKGGSTLGQ